MQFLLKIASCNRLHLSANRLFTVKNRKTTFQMRKSLIKLSIKHLMIIDSIEHENSIKMWENRTNGITKWCSMNHTTKINKRLHHERCRSHLPKVDLENYQPTPSLASNQHQEPISQALIERINEEKVFGWRFSSKISKFQCRTY